MSRMVTVAVRAAAIYLEPRDLDAALGLQRVAAASGIAHGRDDRRRLAGGPPADETVPIAQVSLS
jgi:hypothetical protein